MKKFYEEPLAEFVTFQFEDIMGPSAGEDYVIKGEGDKIDDGFGNVPLF